MEICVSGLYFFTNSGDSQESVASGAQQYIPGTTNLKLQYTMIQ